MSYPLKPYVLGLRVTERCNVGCFHCAISATPKGLDMDCTRAIRAIEQGATWGIRLLHISGGEPLLYKDLAKIVLEGRNAGMFVEMVTSTFSYVGGEIDDLKLLHAAAEAGLRRVLLSYDDGHARTVELKRFVSFALAARELGLEICIYGLEASHFIITMRQIKNAIMTAGFSEESADWITATYSYTGRGATAEPTTHKHVYARCPYVMPVPTLTPDGRVLLCPCAVLSAPAFVLGNQDTEGLGVVLDRLQHSPFYRFLAHYGPHEALRKFGKSEDTIPTEMCAACNHYLQVGEKALAERLSLPDLAIVTVDYEALLPPHRRFLDALFAH